MPAIHWESLGAAFGRDAGCGTRGGRLDALAAVAGCGGGTVHGAVAVARGLAARPAQHPGGARAPEPGAGARGRAAPGAGRADRGPGAHALLAGAPFLTPPGIVNTGPAGRLRLVA